MGTSEVQRHKTMITLLSYLSNDQGFLYGPFYFCSKACRQRHYLEFGKKRPYSFERQKTPYHESECDWCGGSRKTMEKARKEVQS